MRSGLIKVFLLVGTLMVVLTISEWELRHKGFQKGRLVYGGIEPVDTLMPLRGMFADSNGLFLVDESVRLDIAREIFKGLNDTSYSFNPNKPGYSDEQYNLVKDFTELNEGKCKNDFSKFIDSVKKVEHPEGLDSLLLKYTQCPINALGFRSIEFTKVLNSRPSILLLGDSYAWGHKTQNKTNSFPDILTAHGYTVYNAGIGGTDPPQYRKLAEKYIPVLKPDFVLVNFNLSNDLQYFSRQLKPFHPVIWKTNAGYFLSCPDGVDFKDSMEVYKLSVENCFIPQTGTFNKLCSKTVISTLLWSALSKIFNWDRQTPAMHQYQRKVALVTDTIPHSNAQIADIKAICQNNGSNFILVAIPEVYSVNNNYGLRYPNEVKHLFTGMDYYVPRLPIEEYSHDGHFNDTGHLHYAQFLQHIIDSAWYAQKH